MQAERIFFLESEIKNDPNEPFNYYGLAMEYYSNNPLAAEKLFLTLLKQFPDYLPTYYQAANLFFSLEKIDLANSTFKIGIALAEKLKKEKILKELKGSYQQFLDEIDD